MKKELSKYVNREGEANPLSASASFLPIIWLNFLKEFSNKYAPSIKELEELIKTEGNTESKEDLMNLLWNIIPSALIYEFEWLAGANYHYTNKSNEHIFLLELFDGQLFSWNFSTNDIKIYPPINKNSED